MSETVAMLISDSDDRNICIRCGLCCDGSLFRDAVINRHDDLEFVQIMGVSVHEANGKPYFCLPCKGLAGTVCTLYHDVRRFRVCRNFQCSLLKRYLASEISYDAAVKTIQEVITRRQRITALYAELHNVSDPTVISLIEALKKGGNLDDAAFRKKNALHILDCLILEKLLNECFFSNAGTTDMTSNC